MSTTITPAWTLGDRLRKAREVSALDAAEMAERLGVHRNTISNYENGKTKVSRSVVLHWAMVTGVDRDWLLYGDDEPEDGARSTKW